MPAEDRQGLVLVFVYELPPVEQVIPRRFNPSPASQAACEEGVEVVPQVVNDAFREFLWESSCGGLNVLLLAKGPRPGVLVERESQP